MKVCSRCGEEKAAGEFYADKRASDGLHSCCKPCKVASTNAGRTLVNAAERRRFVSDSRDKLRAELKTCRGLLDSEDKEVDKLRAKVAFLTKQTGEAAMKNDKLRAEVEAATAVALAAKQLYQKVEADLDRLLGAVREHLALAKSGASAPQVLLALAALYAVADEIEKEAT